MGKITEDRLAKFILTCGLAAGGVAIAVWASLPVDVLINWIPDDSFYYFQPASLMARGYVPSFDGRNPGNGFHPLWMWLLVPVFKLKTADVNLPIHIALYLAGALYVVAAFLIFKIVCSLTGEALFGAYAAATFLFWPSAVTTAVDGEVTPLNLVVLGMLFLAFIRVLEKRRATRSEAAAVAALAALAVLARNDNALLLVMLGVYYLTRRREENKWMFLGAVTAVVVIVTGLWLIWNRVVTGAFWPTSTWAVPLMSHAAAGHKGWAVFSNSLRNITTNVQRLAFYSPLQLGIVLVYGYVLGRGAWNDPQTQPRIVTLLIYLVFILILYAIHVGVRWYIRAWHLGAAFLVNHIFLWLAVYHLSRDSRRRRLFAHGAAAVLALFFVVDFTYTAVTPYHPWQKEMKAAGEWARARPHLRLGAFNAGIIAYYAADNVTDLDGNMNVSAFDALKERRLYEYLKTERLTYIVDYKEWVYDNYGPFFPERFLDRLEIMSDELDDATVKSICGTRFVIIRVK